MASEHEVIKREFGRDVWCFFGLPVDNLTVSFTKKLLHQLASQNDSSVLSTINVNWVVSSFAKADIRLAILNSNIVSLDGKPLLWLARLLGYPMFEVVAGSTLVQELNETKEESASLALFLFGGEDGVAEKAQEQVNKIKGGLRVVGYINPGFGSVAEMSSDSIINRINKENIDLLLVALGAAKGTKWIELNREKLNAKVISHLGATINFLAGTVKRAPRLFRWAGIEWIWRILQEPKLFSRYACDGIALCYFVARSSFLWLQYRYWLRSFKDSEWDFSSPLKNVTEDCITLAFGQNLRGYGNWRLRSSLSECILEKKNMVFDFKDTEFVDGSFAALLLLCMRWQQKKGVSLKLVNMNSRIKKLFHFFCIDETIKVFNFGK